MPKRSRKPGTDPDQTALSRVEQETADEQEIKKQVDSASEVPRRPHKPPSDPILAARPILAQATGEEPKLEPEVKDPAAVSLGRRGGLKGGHARAKSLTPEQRKESARKAAQARWGKK
jgi:hypothetical protein